VALKVDETGQLGATLQASDIGDLCEEEGISIPGLRDSKASPFTRREDRNKQVGINLKKIFGDIPPVNNPPPEAIELRALELETYEVERWKERASGGTPAKFPLALAEELVSPELAEMRKKYLPPLSDSIQVRDFN